MSVTFTVAELAMGALGAGNAGARRTMPDARPDQDAVRLVLLARAGDREAFGALVDLHHRSARRVALVATGNLADADEAVQDACLTAWRRLAALDDPAAFRSWLLSITWRKALDRRRSIAGWLKRLAPDTAAEALPTDDRQAEQQLIDHERDRAIARTVRSLPARLRDPLLLAASGEHRYEDMATLLGIPLGTVKWRVSEARRLVRLKLERLGFGDPR